MKKHRHIFARYIMKPRDPRMTSIKGYLNDPKNQKYDEIVGFSVGLKPKDLTNSQIILDIDGQTVVKNSMSDNDNWAQLMDYFLKAYEADLMNFMRRTSG